MWLYLTHTNTGAGARTGHEHLVGSGPGCQIGDGGCLGDVALHDAPAGGQPQVRPGETFGVCGQIALGRVRPGNTLPKLRSWEARGRKIQETPREDRASGGNAGPPRGRCMRWLPRVRGGILHPRSWGYREPSCGCQVACGLGKTMGRLRPAVSYGRCRGQTPAGSSCAAVFPRALCRLRRGTQLGLERWPSPQATVRMSSGLIPRCMRHLLSLLARSRAAG